MFPLFLHPCAMLLLRLYLTSSFIWGLPSGMLIPQHQSPDILQPPPCFFSLPLSFLYFADLGQTSWILCKKTEREGCCSSDHMIATREFPPIEYLGTSITAERWNHTKGGRDTWDVCGCIRCSKASTWGADCTCGGPIATLSSFSLSLPPLTTASWHFLYPRLFLFTSLLAVGFSSRSFPLGSQILPSAESLNQTLKLLCCCWFTRTTYSHMSNSKRSGYSAFQKGTRTT